MKIHFPPAWQQVSLILPCSNSPNTHSLLDTLTSIFSLTFHICTPLIISLLLRHYCHGMIFIWSKCSFTPHKSFLSFQVNWYLSGARRSCEPSSCKNNRAWLEKQKRFTRPTIFRRQLTETLTKSKISKVSYQVQNVNSPYRSSPISFQC